jgi:recombination protein RecA
MARTSKSTENQAGKSKLDESLARLNKEYGQGSVFRIGDNPSIEVTDFISTGSLNLDRAVGVNGLPTGRIVEIYGPESSGKTTICLHVIKEAQKKSKKAAFVDMENALDLKYASDIGVDVKNLIFAQPNYGEEALNIVKELCLSGEVGVIIIDSVAALVPKTEADGEVGDSNVGKQARMISQAMRILTPIVHKSGTLVIFTNQIRMKIGVMFGSPETTAGGEALKFFASVRLDVRKSVQREDGVATSNKIKVKVVKNKVSIPFREAEFFIIYGKGIDKLQEIIDIAVESNIIQKSGSWYAYGNDKLGQGEDSIKQLMIDNEDFYNEIEKKVQEVLNGKKEENRLASVGESGETETIGIKLTDDEDSIIS